MLSTSADPPATRPAPQFRAERPQDAARVDRLIADAFGPGRYAKAAERLREGARPDRDLSLLAWDGDEAVGCVRLWPIDIGGTQALLLGPFAVAASRRSQGLGAALVERACEAAQAAGHALVVLVGDEAYFARVGFSAVPPGCVTLPGPVDRARLLWRALKPGAADGVAGEARAIR